MLTYLVSLPIVGPHYVLMVCIDYGILRPEPWNTLGSSLLLLSFAGFFVAGWVVVVMIIVIVIIILILIILLILILILILLIIIIIVVHGVHRLRPHKLRRVLGRRVGGLATASGQRRDEGRTMVVTIVVLWS
jgi:apolipoprotein N-acyltransferase